MASEEPQKKKAKADVPVSLELITPANVKQLTALNQVIFPISYSSKFYEMVAKEENASLSKLAFHNGGLVGAICTRYEENTLPQLSFKTSGLKRLYIMTLGVLAPYRGYGIGTKLLNSIVEFVEHRKGISDMFLHVQINNEDALAFYKRHGFKIIGMDLNYYRRIEPKECYILSKAYDANDAILANQPERSVEEIRAEAEAQANKPETDQKSSQ